MFEGLRDRRVVVNGKDGDAWRGTVVSADRHVLRLENWTYYSSDGAETPSDGIVRIPEALISWIIEVD